MKHCAGLPWCVMGRKKRSCGRRGRLDNFPHFPAGRRAGSAGLNFGKSSPTPRLAYGARLRTLEFATLDLDSLQNVVDRTRKIIAHPVRATGRALVLVATAVLARPHEIPLQTKSGHGRSNILMRVVADLIVRNSASQSRLAVIRSRSADSPSQSLLASVPRTIASPAPAGRRPAQACRLWRKESVTALEVADRSSEETDLSPQYSLPLPPEL